MRTMFLLVTFLGVSGLASETDCKDDSKFKEVTKTELTELIAKKEVTVIDVNSKSSFKKSHIPTATHFGSVEKGFQTFLPKDKTALVVAYCGGPQCSAWKKAAQAACNAGYTNIKHFKGGISGWNKKT